MRTLLLCSLVLISLGIAGAQAAQAPPAVAVSGSVTDAVTGEPLRRALVSLYGLERYFALTNASGQFQIEKVAAGRYNVTVDKPGYFDPGTISPTRIMPAISVSAAEFQPLRIKLLPEATISGRVLDSSGEPVEGANVQCLEANIDTGRLAWNHRGMAFTGEDGSYEISNLPPGRYRLRLDQMQVPAFDMPLRVAGRIPIEVYPFEFYPNAPDEAGAQTLQLGAGSHLKADFTVTAVPAFRVTGTVTSPVQYFGLYLENSSGTPVGPTSGNSDRRWSLNIPAGSWKVVADVQGNPRYYAERIFDVRSRDVPNINLTLQPLRDIPIRVTGPAGSASHYVQIGLTNKKETRFSDAAGEDGSARVQNVPPGRYRVFTQFPGHDACIDTITSGSVDLSRDELTVSAGINPAPIDVALRSDCAELSVDLNSAEVSAATVLLLPESRFLNPIVLEAQSGTVHFPKLSPGQYVAYAFSSIDDLEYANPEALREYSGQSITLTPNEHAEVKLAVNQRGGQ
jgi:hypothetical protein